MCSYCIVLWGYSTHPWSTSLQPGLAISSASLTLLPVGPHSVSLSGDLIVPFSQLCLPEHCSFPFLEACIPKSLSTIFPRQSSNSLPFNGATFPGAARGTQATLFSRVQHSNPTTSIQGLHCLTLLLFPCTASQVTSIRLLLHPPVGIPCSAQSQTE